MSGNIFSDDDESKPVKLRILDTEVQIACRPSEEHDLAKAAAHVDKSMRELRLRNASSSIEKIAIVTAINTANSLLQSRSNDSSDSSDSSMTDQIATINANLKDLLQD